MQCRLPIVVMATPGYVEELQQPTQQPGGALGVTPGQPPAPPTSTPPAPPPFLAELQTAVTPPPVTATAPPQTGQATPPAAQATSQKQATPAQYVTAEIQGSGTASSNGQSTPQYIVVTVTEGSLHSSDSVSDSSPPPPAVQTAVPTQVVQQRLCIREREEQVEAGQMKGSVTGGRISSEEPPWAAGVPLCCTVGHPPLSSSPSPRPTPSRCPLWMFTTAPQWSCQLWMLRELTAMHRVERAGRKQVQIDRVQQLQSVPVQHVYSSQVQYVDGGETSYTTSTIRSSSYTYTDTPLYTQTGPSSYYEAPPASGAQVAAPATSQAVPVTAGGAAVSMFVANTTSGTATAGTVAVVAGSTPGGAAAAAGAGGGTTAAGAGGTGGGSNGGSGSSYVIQGGYMLSGAAGNQNYSHSIRASPATVQWLLDNYETAEGVSLPRSTLYCHYLLHCQEQKQEPVNAASFGKLIRSVFMGLRTRRLGTRGNSKYHYYGLRIKGSSSLLRLMEDQQHLAMRQQPFSQKQRLKPVQKVEGMTNGMGQGVGQQQGAGLSDISAQVQQYQQFLDASRSLPEFSEIDLQGKALPEGIMLEHIRSFQLLYREHCEAILDVMINLQFTLVETLWKTFWRFSENPAGDVDPLSVHDESEKRLPKSCLVLLCKYEPVVRWSRQCDNTLYQSLVEILIPDVLRPIPSALTQAIRNFAKSLESWLTNAMMNIPEEMVRIKVTSASAFAQTLRRYTSLNHLAQAARAVLQNTAQINQMLSDLNRVDFANVQEQASWVCRCEDRLVQQLEQDFKLTLQQQNSLEQWAAWLDGVVSQVLKPYQASATFPKAAKLFLLKWSFYSSMVIRDLTLRSAASFGSFHLIRLLYDEYMYYLIEQRVAQAKGETPIAVMGEFASLGRSLNTLDPDKEEEEDEEEDSDDECQELTLPADSSGLGEESLEPPAKLARTDPRGLFSTSHTDN
ncbi:MHC class II regulatory factor RFX1 isoform X2 [Paramormyrops kingsleyae]|uniref:Regulatory factor X, 1a (influences HLA class II expression) n=1 Tax=Paramormyrops kingsleyae TaxID=1676925 RepID=A0A3B3REK1_9TELE|nr:MHC class II regulatory factor RFX1 isoform X2 [Paramormyrops kingsleyae]